MTTPTEMTMSCSRCSSPNAMQAEYIPGASLWMARCIFCGDRVDGVILENRRATGWTAIERELKEVAGS